MATVVFERFGYRATDHSPEALLSRSEQHCPFIDAACKKASIGGVCSLGNGEARRPIIVCPSRLYFQDHQFLAEIAADAFNNYELNLDLAGLPLLVPGSKALAVAADTGLVQIGVLGQGWDSELRLPPTAEGGGGYSIDFTLIAVGPGGELLGFSPVEVQTIDTTGSYREGLRALDETGEVVPTNAGFNFENVSKRILPQLIVKGLMLQGERLCTHGIYFVTPLPVFDKIAIRLGGMDRLRTIPKQPGSITFVQYDYPQQETPDGLPLTLSRAATTTISTSDMSIAFISPQNLPDAGAYETRLRSRLGLARS